MKRPKWATIVGILGIVFGCLGILAGGQEVLMPKMLKIQKEMFSEMAKDADKQQTDPGSYKDSRSQKPSTSGQNSPPDAFKSFEKMFEVPPWFEAWSILSGIMKSLISAFYLFAAIWLLMIKPSAIKLFYCAAGASIVLSAVHGIIAFSAGSFMFMAMAFTGVFGLLIDVVLIIVVAIGDKTAYQPVPVRQTTDSGNAEIV